MGHTIALARDYSLQCYTPKWDFHAFIAATAGLSFVVGIPILFLALLYNAREANVDKLWASCLRFPGKRKQLLKEAKADADIHGQFWTVDRMAMEMLVCVKKRLPLKHSSGDQTCVSTGLTANLVSYIMRTAKIAGGMKLWN